MGSVERVKAKLEKACPNTVSCADVLALMARDAVWLVSAFLINCCSLGDMHFVCLLFTLHVIAFRKWPHFLLWITKVKTSAAS
jgi:Peroxidase